jgi:uncharacterized protein (TIGR02996 family)
MTDAGTLLRAVLAQPEDEAVRLVYADWLEEQGDPRAEFIRLQIALAHSSPADARHFENKARAGALLKKHQQTWLGPLAKFAKAWHFSRGFVENVTLETKTFLKLGDELFHFAPLRGLRLINVRDHFEAVAESPCLSRLSALDLNNNSLGAQRIQRILGSPHLSNLQSLSIGYNAIGISGLQAALDPSRLPSLSELDLSGNFNGGSSMQVLARSRELFRLKSLSLVYNRYGDEEVETLAASPYVANLSSLDLGSNSVDARGLRALAFSPHLARLKSLRLHYLTFSEAGIQALASSPHWAELGELDLTHGIGMCNLEALTNSSSLLRLHRLDLSENNLTTRNIGLLANATSLERLRQLGLRKCGIKYAEARMLLNSEGLAGLKCLELGGNPLTAKAALRKAFGARVRF